MNEIGVSAEELDDLVWALVEAFPEVDVNPVHSPEFWAAKATQLLPVINKIRERSRQEGRVITLDEALEKTIIHEQGCGWETGPYCTCGADPERAEDPHDADGNRLTPEWSP